MTALISKLKNYDAHLQPLSNVPTNYQLPTPGKFSRKFCILILHIFISWIQDQD